MDVLRPKLTYVEGRCYRINNPEVEYCEKKQSGVDWDDNPTNYGGKTKFSKKGNKIKGVLELERIKQANDNSPWWLKATGNDCTLEEPCDDVEADFEIVQTESGRYKTSFHVARVYYAPIIGTRGQTKKRLEEETKTIIKVPRQPQDHEVLITGSTKTSVASARRRVQLIVMTYRKKQQPTHFLSFPMISQAVKERFNLFKQQVLQGCQARGIEEEIFQNPDKLHLTLCTLVLTDNVERAEATNMLENCKRDVIDPLMEGNSITILLSGIEYMNDDPTEVDVLYARVHACDILQTLVDNVVDYFCNAGLGDKQYERVKLHVTIMNTNFRSSRHEEKGKHKTRETFNAKPILEMFRDFDFGEISIDAIHLSTRFTTSKTNGYYQSSSEISLFM